jgi:exopolysaccharide biosynthesis polyprenyl glycosylphosphotransferase
VTKPSERNYSPLRPILARKRCLAVTLAFDLIALFAAWHLTIEIRVLANPLVVRQFDHAALKSAAPPLSGLLLLWLLVAVWLQVYQRDQGGSAVAECLRVAESGTVAAVVAIVITFFSRELGTPLSRSFVILFLPASVLMLSTARYLARRVSWLLETREPARERVAMFGHGREVRRLTDHIRDVWSGQCELVGSIMPDGALCRGLGNGVPVLGTTRELGEVINRQRLQRIVMVEGGSPKREADKCQLVAKRMGVIVTRSIGNGTSGAHPHVLDLSGVPLLLELTPIYFTRRQEVIKRIFDIVISALVLVLMLPAFAVFITLVKASSAGPVFYKSLRVGRGGRYFMFLKFRSMRDGSGDRRTLKKHNEKSGHIFKIRNDPRVTRLGRFMRRYSIDELPQLINVLRGEMSLVGPRPLPAQDLDPDGQSRLFRFWAEQRSRVLPGITGLWQISGRSNLSFDKMRELDVQYIQNWSLFFDLRILVTTPLVVISARGAY